MPYQLYNNTVCVPHADFLSVYSSDMYKNLKRRGDLKVVKPGKGKGNTALIELDSIKRNDVKESLIRKLGPQPKQQASVSGFKNLVGIDGHAVVILSKYEIEDGRPLPVEAYTEYLTNANLLNAIHAEIIKCMDAQKRKTAPAGYWQLRATELQVLKADPDFKAHTLPKNGQSLQRVYTKYIESVKRADEDGNIYTTPNYESLVSGRFGNNNTLKVDKLTERVLLSIYTLNNRPFANEVHNNYSLFIQGKINLLDTSTGELFDAADFKAISLKTVKNWLKNGLNDAIADSKRMGFKNFNDEQMPHNRRIRPQYAFSKISMDDRDLPRKLASGKRVKAYYAYDVASGAVVGYSHSQSKDEELFLGCMHNLFQTVYANNWNMPYEFEVENHLVSKFFAELKIMVPYLQVCKPMNSQQKAAEHFNKAKKYSAEKKVNATAVGRWWAKGKAYRVDQDFVNDEFVGKGYSYDKLVADDLQAIKIYNNELHPKQKLYPGLTRWEVLQLCQHKDLKPVDKALVAKCIGNKTTTTIRRNQAIQVQYAEYRLPNLNVLNRLQPGNKQVDAYWLPSIDGVIPEVYVYQNNAFVGSFSMIERYQEAVLERTPEDTRIMERQFAEKQRFIGAVKQGREGLMPIAIIPVEELKFENYNISDDKVAFVVPPTPEEPEEFDMANLHFDENAIIASARKDI